MGKLTTLVFASVIGVSALPACGDPAAPQANASFADGTRLKAVHYQIDGAPPSFLGWYDSALGVDCSFSNENLLDDPVCLPSQPWQPVFASDASLFADGTCSEPIVGTDYPGESRYFMRPAEPNGGAVCDWTPARLFHLGDVVPAGASLYALEESTGACRPATQTQANAYAELHLLGPEIPIDTLVRGTLQHDAGPGRIVPLTIAGSDGSLQGAIVHGDWIIAWDNARQASVTAPTWLPQDGRWYPLSSYDASYFSDAACSIRAAPAVGCGSLARVASIRTTDACGRSAPTSFFDMGPQLSDAAALYYNGYTAAGGTACVPADELPVTDPSYIAFSVGAPIPPTSFAETSEVHTGTAQLRVIQAGSPDGPAMAELGFYDSVHGQPCFVSVTGADDPVRCLPGTFDTGPPTYFADEACSVPLVANLPPDGPCTPTPTIVSLDDPYSQAGPRHRHFHSIGDPYVGMVYVTASVPSPCFALGIAPEGDRMFTFGPEIPAASFAPVNLVRPN